ncbi:aspartic proteinase-like protein 2 [Pyrus ussuriensis x Pyrus communis]|uniref:Aspartic proteinase-like protein 2 n=1 Tax=Pyrus ussuriensis x Pyrus communis TaxID=2448454 RepID=A0A5N5FPY4_9ROSA|nr:aspartic proteinase-like protein 2 [Pyrus ussuriensis x Pyrus communis]
MHNHKLHLTTQIANIEKKVMEIAKIVWTTMRIAKSHSIKRQTMKLDSPPRQFYASNSLGSNVVLIIPPNICMLQIPSNFYNPANSSTARLFCSIKFCKVGLGTECSHQINHCSYNLKYEGGDETARHYISDKLHFDMILMWYLCVQTFGGDYSFNQLNIWIQPRVDVCHIIVVLLRGNFQCVLHCLKGESKGCGILILVQILETSIVVPLLCGQSMSLNLKFILFD